MNRTVKMNLKESNLSGANQVTCSKESRGKSSPRISDSTSARGLRRFDLQKVGQFENNKENESIVRKTKTSRSSIPVSNSCNKTLNGAEETKRPPSMIPRSKSRRRTPTENFKPDHSSIMKEGKDLERKKEEGLTEEKVLTQNLSPSISQREDILKDITSPSLSLKSCEGLEIQRIFSDSSYKDAQEVISQEIKIAKEECLKPVKTKEEEETERQERMIKNLYETINQTKGPFFEDLSWMEKPAGITSKEKVQHDGKKNEGALDSKVRYKCLGNFPSIQDYYDYTIQEISEIWKNTISLIASVKDHTLKFVDEKSQSTDKEQLSLEAEMLQLAVDFAVNFSKLKTDFLLSGVKKHLEVKEIEKSELETFLDSKTFAAMYNDEDLAAMAQTVRELNASVLKGDDTEID